jgi:hypothetical protein
MSREPPFGGFFQGFLTEAGLLILIVLGVLFFLWLYNEFEKSEAKVKGENKNGVSKSSSA